MKALEEAVVVELAGFLLAPIYRTVEKSTKSMRKTELLSWNLVSLRDSDIGRDLAFYVLHHFAVISESNTCWLFKHRVCTCLVTT